MASSDSIPNFIVTGGAGFVGSNLTLALQEKFPDARITVIDDFRSGNFKNLAGYSGDFLAQNLATLDWHEQFGDGTFDTIFISRRSRIRPTTTSSSKFTTTWKASGGF